MRETLFELLEKLTEPQLDAISHVAEAMLYSNPRSDDEYITVNQIEEDYDRPASSVYSAMNRGALPYKTPNGQSRPRYAKRADVELWMGIRAAQL